MAKRRHRDIGLVLIAIFKLIKGVLLFVVGIEALSLLRKDQVELINRWAHILGLQTHNRWIQDLLIKLGMVDKRELGLIVGTTFFYSVLLLTEGLGLLLEKVWAEYLTFVITASFIPIEVYELTKRVTGPRIAILTLNMAAAAYLAFRIRQRERAKR